MLPSVCQDQSSCIAQAAYINKTDRQSRTNFAMTEKAAAGNSDQDVISPVSYHDVLLNSLAGDFQMLLLAFGFGMIALTVAIHTTGAAWWLSRTSRRIQQGVHKHRRLSIFYIISTTASALLLLHLLEAMLWAVLYIILPGRSGLANFAEALYFSMITFTTLGYGDVTLAPEWRSLAGMEAMVGIVVFGLSTAILFAMIQRSWQAFEQRK